MKKINDVILEATHSFVLFVLALINILMIVRNNILIEAIIISCVGCIAFLIFEIYKYLNIENSFNLSKLLLVLYILSTIIMCFM